MHNLNLTVVLLLYSLFYYISDRDNNSIYLNILNLALPKFRINWDSSVRFLLFIVFSFFFQDILHSTEMGAEM